MSTPAPGVVASHDYCVKHGLYVSKSDGPVSNTEIDYLLLNGWSGGRVKVTPVQDAGFIRAYTRDLVEGCKILSYVQRRTLMFPFFMDIDVRMKSLAHDTAELRQQLIRPVLQAVQQCGAVNNELALVCTTHAKPCADLVKCGMHIHFPGLVVDANTARAIRSIVLQNFRPVPNVVNPPEDIYDEVVFLANGLRMPGSVKFTPCKCRGQSSCPDCRGVGKIMDTVDVTDPWTGETRTVGRTYTLTMALHLQSAQWLPDAPTLSRLRNLEPDSVHEMLGLLSVRSAVKSMPQWFRLPDNVEMPSLIVPSKRRKVQVYNQFPEDVTGLNRHVADHTEIINPDQLAVLKNVVDQVLIAGDTRRTGMYIRSARAGDKTFTLFVGGAGSTLCGNMPNDGMHRSNSVYFVVSISGVIQRCFCTCLGKAARRVNKIDCKSYQSPRLALPDDLRLQLFPAEILQEQAVKDRITGRSARRSKNAQFDHWHAVTLTVHQILSTGPVAVKRKVSKREL
jgi:hypothetical protein